MSANTELNLSRRSLLASFACGTTMFLPKPGFALSLDSEPAENYGNLLFDDSENGLFQIYKDDNVLTYIDLGNGEKTIAFIATDQQSMTIKEPDGTQRECFVDSLGDIYIDGALAIEACTESPTLTRSVPSGYVYLTRYRTNTVVTGSVASLTLTLLGLVPGMAGAAAIAGAILAIQGLSGEVIYIEITQYYHPNTYYIYEVTRLYRNSNYTGLINTIEKGPFPPV